MREEMRDDNAGSTESSRAGQQNPAKVFPLLKKLQTDCLAAVRSPEHGPRVGLRMELCGYEDKLVNGTVVLVCKRCQCVRAVGGLRLVPLAYVCTALSVRV